jgi:hypothetical protein
LTISPKEKFGIIIRRKSMHPILKYKRKREIILSVAKQVIMRLCVGKGLPTKTKDQYKKRKRKKAKCDGS